ncbi:hypothetical protein BCR32DRAFT_328490 [Anaeromyces robustus]|uniref:Uncharacterized protein n=1 Tax=Anaeromyces robustus TaxID=1754192 RepID=A0A1Y1WZB2_9FUNG|nr:hypothetical protein BCR32DRAFT_328490 [Anaeromyces robustus]|eukprot:ORX78526.1 hypothetical protein BCR32DRAFT_328490 [Anaeromyces robustus]
MEKISESEMQRRREIWINTPLTKLIDADELLSDNFVYNKPSRKHNDISIRESINNDISNTKKRIKITK